MRVRERVRARARVRAEAEGYLFHALRNRGLVLLRVARLILDQALRYVSEIHRALHVRSPRRLELLGQ